ncbi:MAG: DUF393 domain-containing protein [Phycisphaerales bacterium]|nr:DUF393 domain-containing protein [Phycisphaerales bacterium]
MLQATTHPASDRQIEARVVFYDGECGLCSGSVRWFLGRDRHARLKFAPLQGQTYASLAGREKPRGLDTIVYQDGSGLHVRSTAVLRAMLALGGVWRIVGRAGLLVPRPLRDAIYRFIARHRLAWFGTADACSLPTPEQAARFLP